MWLFLSYVFTSLFEKIMPILISVVVRIIVSAISAIFSIIHALFGLVPAIRAGREERLRIALNEAELSAERTAPEGVVAWETARARRLEEYLSRNADENATPYTHVVGARASESSARAAQERAAAQEAAQAAEFARVLRRDADVQDTPYKYVVGTHGNESLAIRYGIANQVRKTKAYWYRVRGGEKIRDADRDKVYYEPSGEIRLQKVRKVGDARYEVLLTDFRDRRGIAVIEPGTEYVKTFLPLDEQWFSQNADLELTLKGNGTFDLKELARIHVDKAVGRKG